MLPTITYPMKERLNRIIIVVIIFISSQLQLGAQKKYTDYKSLLKKIEQLSKDNQQLCSSRLLVKTAGGREIRVLSIGSGNKDSKPAVAIFGGVDGRYILGRELSLGFAESLLRDSSSPEVKELLDKITFYIFPDVNPDASEQFFADVKYERTGNARSTDEDRDFASDEDGFEDLNKDGLITLIRVEDPAGRYIKSKEDERVMTEADISKGQSGNYMVYSEGVDNDKDGFFNEDGPGGVNFNRNFSFDYESFGLQAGMYPFSEPETRTVADFLFDRFNIYAVFTFGPQDNLGQPWKAASEGEKIIKSVMKADETINRLVSDRYHEITGVTGSPPEEADRGNFAEWAYFHYGRYSFSTPAWWFPVEKGKSREAAFLKYADSSKIRDVFVPWTRADHPDFPGRITETGGIKPFAMLNPPADSLELMISRNYKFIRAIAAMHPELELLDIKSESAGEGVFRVSVKLHNKGIFATCARIGDENMYTRIMRISLEPAKAQSIVSGQKIQKVERLEGGNSAEFSWLISGKGSLKVTAGALNTGTVSTIIELR
jgi:hypothetical protein